MEDEGRQGPEMEVYYMWSSLYITHGQPSSLDQCKTQKGTCVEGMAAFQKAGIIHGTIVWFYITTQFNRLNL